jgi:glycosyltransferase involved in cell wall biosynthesis
MGTTLPRLLIGTQHPSFGGGVLTLARAFLDWVRSRPNLSPALAYTTLARGDPANGALLRRPHVVAETWEGVPASCVGRRIRGVEALATWGSRRLWQDVLDPFDLHQVICGYAVTGLPQALSGKRYVVWVASSMDGDKRARLERGGLLRRLAHRVQRPALLRQERFVLERAAHVLALSPRTEAELLERGADPERTSVLTCPVDLGTLTPAASPPSRPIVLSVGRLNDARKNAAMLVRAFARIAGEVPDARLVLAGEGDPKPLRPLAPGRVDFPGRVGEGHLRALYRTATVFAIPSEQEGLCIAGLEAMACGIPVVSTRCGGPEAFVIPPRTGLLVDVGSESQMADALLYVLRDHTARAEMGREARRLVEEQFSSASFARRLDEVYAAVWPEHWAAAP